MYKILLLKAIAKKKKKSQNHAHKQSGQEECSYFSYCQMTPPTPSHRQVRESSGPHILQT